MEYGFLRLTDLWDHHGGPESFLADRLGAFGFWAECALFDLEERNMKKIGIVMGSDSDLPVIEKATNTLSALGIEFEVHVYSAHRTPDEAAQYAQSAQERGIGVLIAAAGMAAHLAGAIAARTTLPVIGIPCKSSNLGGIEALLSTVQMPGGIPVATVAIDGGVNAALLAAQILALSDEELDKKLKAHRQAQYEGVLAKDKAIAERFN